MKTMYLFQGCMIRAKQYGYELSLRATLPLLGVELEEMQEANCCGTPLRGVSVLYPVYAAARLLAMAEGAGRDIVTPCNGCHLTLSENARLLKEQRELLEQVNTFLRDDGLKYTGAAHVYHPVELLHDIIGLDKVVSSISRMLPPLRFASHPGCHLVRPSGLHRPEARNGPLKLDRLLRVIGLQQVDSPEKYECCGAALLPYSGEAALRVGSSRLSKLADIRVDGVATLCPYCFEMLDGKQDAAKMASGDARIGVPVLYHTQLLGLAMGMNERGLGLNLNLSPIDGVLARLSR